MKTLLWVLLFPLLFTPAMGSAVLGEKISSIEKDKSTFSILSQKTTLHNQYTIHELVQDGLTIREFVSNDGMIFGIAWHGVAHPDLNKLLGSYLNDYHEAMTTTSRKGIHQKFSSIQGQHVVVEKGGHMRSARGRAYVPSLLPSGVNTDEIH